MVQSMTGFGKALMESDNYTVQVEIKSLNSKQADLNIKIPKEIGSHELAIRNLVSKELTRGKISVLINIENKSSQQSVNIDQGLLDSYYTMLSNSADKLNASKNDIFKIALNMPDVMISSQDSDQGLFSIVEPVIKSACHNLIEFRKSEGENLEAALLEYVSNIEQSLNKIIEIEPVRKESTRNRILSSLGEVSEVNNDRFEQELIYYIEKLDITEEITRLKSHIKYFLEQLPVENNGKKIGFICQEIGREINTIGSKANYAEIQKLVINMKDDLEKIKEQSLNIL